MPKESCSVSQGNNFRGVRTIRKMIFESAVRGYGGRVYGLSLFTSLPSSTSCSFHYIRLSLFALLRRAAKSMRGTIDGASHER